jgi:hypothetical protein
LTGLVEQDLGDDEARKSKAIPEMIERSSILPNVLSDYFQARLNRPVRKLSNPILVVREGIRHVSWVTSPKCATNNQQEGGKEQICLVLPSSTSANLPFCKFNFKPSLLM